MCVKEKEKEGEVLPLSRLKSRSFMVFGMDWIEAERETSESAIGKSEGLRMMMLGLGEIDREASNFWRQNCGDILAGK